MRITDAYSKHVDVGAARSTQTEGTQSQKGREVQEPPPDAVQVSISERAIRLANKSDVDVDKVNRLRGAMDRGDFQVDADKIAQKIVDG